MMSEDFIPDEYLNFEYDMEVEASQRTGLCVIFNSCTFDADCLPTREGSDQDVASIQKVFGDTFRFHVQEFKDKTKVEMETELKNIASTFNPVWRCIVCFFLSHGLKEEYLADYKGNRVNVRMLAQHFDGENCPKMIGKPKLFFVQMCRGFDREEYIWSHKKYDSAAEDVLQDSVPPNVCPDRDRLICYATTEGRMAPIDPERGSLFIQTLTMVLEKLSEKEIPIEKVLKVVTRIVDKKSEEQYKVCPVFDSTLVGRLVFRAKPKQDVNKATLGKVDKLMKNIGKMTI